MHSGRKTTKRLLQITRIAVEHCNAAHWTWRSCQDDLSISRLSWVLTEEFYSKKKNKKKIVQTMKFWLFILSIFILTIFVYFELEY